MKKVLLNILLMLVIFGGSYTFAAPANNVIISEVQYDPTGHENRGEWLELYNPTSGTIDIGGWTIEEEQTLTSGPFMGQPRTFTFYTGTTIPAGGYLLVVNSIADFNTNGLGTLGIAPLDTVSYVEMMYGSGCNHISSLGCLQLNNGTNATHIDYLLLKDNNSNSIDETRWGDYGHTSPANSNTSVCRITSDDTDSASDWMSNCTPTPGSQPIVGFLIFNPYITLQGLGNINLEVNSFYNDSGAIYTDSRGTGFATISGSVNTGALGTYILEYLHTDLSGNIAESVYRTINITDQTPPVVTLIGPASQTIALGSVHVDQGASRSDNLDGSGTNVIISGSVNSSLIGTYILQYTYTDTSGNTGNTVSRSITVTDQTPPIVTLIGSASQTIALGSVYSDLGASRSDNLDGSGTNVTVSGSVNSSLIGTYILQYTYTDTSGNTGNTVSRSVTVADQTPPVVTTGNTGVSGGGGGYSPIIKDNCPNGDYTYSYYDNQCGQAPIDEVVPNPNDIYNGSIIDGYCHTRKSNAYITNHKNYTTSEEFKKALTFLYAYDMTIFNDIDTFQPNSYLTRQQAAKIFSNFAMNVLCREPDITLQPSYSDIDNTNETLKPYIIKAYQLGLMKGGDDGKFRPYANISKAAFNAVLVRMILKSYLPENSTVRYSEYNKVATHLDIIKKGASTTPISRKDASLMLFRAYKNQLFSLQNIDYESFVLQNRGQFIP